MFRKGTRATYGSPDNAFGSGPFLRAHTDAPCTEVGAGGKATMAVSERESRVEVLDRDTFNRAAAREWEHFVNEVVRMRSRHKEELEPNNRADAEDTVQRALMKAWEKRGTYRAIGPLRSWLFAYVSWTYRSERGWRAGLRRPKLHSIVVLQAKGWDPRWRGVSYLDSVRRYMLPAWILEMLPMLRKENPRYYTDGQAGCMVA